MSCRFSASGCRLPHMLSCLIVLWLCIFGTAHAHPSPVLLQPLTTEQGLSNDNIDKLFIDRHGLLWIGTTSGLNRFDGRHVLHVRSQQHEIRELHFNNILELTNGRLFAVARYAGIFEIDSQLNDVRMVLPVNRFELPVLPEISDVIAQDSEHLLLAVYQHVYRFNLLSGSLETLFSLPNKNRRSQITQLTLDGEQLYIAGSNELYRLTLKSGATAELLFENAGRPRQLFRHQHQWYLAMGSRLYRQDADGNFRSIVPSINIRAMASDGADLLLATQQGMVRYRDGVLQPVFKYSGTQYNINQDIIPEIIATGDGGFWLSSRSDGAYYWHPRSQAFSQISLVTDGRNSNGQLSLNASIAAAISAADEHRIWISTGEGLKRFDSRTDQVEHITLPPHPDRQSNMTATRVYAMPAGHLWLRTSAGMRQLSADFQHWQPLSLPTTIDPDLFGPQSLGHYQDANSRIWFYTNDDYFCYDPVSQQLRVLQGIKHQLPTHLAGRFLGQIPSQPDLMFIGAADQLWVFNQKTNHLQLLYQASDYQPALQRYPDRILQDHQGILWASFNGIGLLGFSLQDFSLQHHLRRDFGLPSNNVSSLEIDQQGMLWFSSGNGLSRLDPSNLRFEHFDRRNGLATLDFMFAVSIRLHDGRLVFGNSKGLTLFNPAKLQAQTLPPTLLITALKPLQQGQLQSLAILNQQALSFHHSTNGLELQLASPSYQDNSDIRFEVSLTGAQQITFPAQRSTSLILPHLSAGRYSLQVQALNSNSGLRSELVQVHFAIAPPPWRTPLALSSYVIITISLFLYWAYNRQRQQRLLENAQLKIQASEQRLKQALEAVNSGAWEWHADKNSIYGQRITGMLGYSAQHNPMSLTQFINLIHPADRDGYLQTWRTFMDKAQLNTALSHKTANASQDKATSSFDFTYRLKHQDGSWLWFRDIGKITEQEDRKVKRVLGTYSNITDTLATKEKARLFGQAFQQTRDWVVLLDKEQRVIAANQSFADVFGNMDTYLRDPRVHALGINLERRRYYTKLLNQLVVNQHWQGEEIVSTPDGNERPTLINISAVGSGDTVESYVLVFTDITAQKQAEDELRYLANYDVLTGLPNRALLMDRIHHGIDQAKREQRTLALCFIDLDKFKQINDSLGHDIGDLLLQKVAKRLTATLRDTDTVARLGGDEFVVLLESYKNQASITHVARKMLSAISKPMQLAGHAVSVSPSIGIAVYPDDACDGRELLKHADVAMYHAKDLGRNNFQFFTAEMNLKAQQQLELETNLRHAYGNDEFSNAYQPIYDTAREQMVGVEVLMRWHHPNKSVSPVEFIPLAEDLRLIVPMTQQLLLRAMHDLQQWRQQGFDLYISVNLSPRHLEQTDFAMHIRDLLEQFSLPARCLKFEVTESALMQDHQSAIETMLALSAQGIQLALDDFGTGYSSLKYLKELPIDAIKIDRSFVKDIGIDRNDETIIDAMLSMANSLGMYCIAEGVETDQQLSFFTMRQCHLIQGYLFGKPMSSTDLLRVLQEQQPRSVTTITTQSEPPL